jgi:hypothetical protein
VIKFTLRLMYHWECTAVLTEVVAGLAAANPGSAWTYLEVRKSRKFDALHFTPVNYISTSA